MKSINVLSLFDGMSCGRIALERANIPVRNYYSSEIDKYAIKVADKNYPQDVENRLGDVTAIDATNTEAPTIDLLIGGSPCQGFSFAGKQLNFDDPRSMLFFEFTRLLKETSAKYFLLENVGMKKDYQDVISEYLGVQPIVINSELVSAQNRLRLYWTNIPGVTQPTRVNTTFGDILEDIEGDRPYVIRAFKPDAICHHTGTATDIKGNQSILRVYAKSGKCPTLTTMGGGHRQPKVACGNGLYRKTLPIEHERLQTVPEGYTEGVSVTQRNNMLGNGWTIDVISHILSFIPRN